MEGVGEAGIQRKRTGVEGGSGEGYGRYRREVKKEHLRECRRRRREELRQENNGNEIRKQTSAYRERAKVLCIKVKLITRSECSQTRLDIITP